MVAPAVDHVILNRDCQAIQIPYGTPITLREGARVFITQQLGDTFTVQTDTGYLVRVDGTYADALGVSLDSKKARLRALPDGPVDEEAVWEQLRTCYDPEIPCNIVELGLIYSCKIEQRDEGRWVHIEMTLTAPGCGMGQVLHDDVQRKVAELPGVSGVDVELTFDPAWDPSMMTEAARLQLGFM